MKQPNSGAFEVKNVKSGSSSKPVDLKDIECFRCHKKGHYASKCPEIRSKETKSVFKVRKMEETSSEPTSDTSMRQIRIRYSDLQSTREDVFMRYWVLLFNKGDPIQSLNNPGHAVKVFVDTRANVNTISKKFRDYLISRGLQDTLSP